MIIIFDNNDFIKAQLTVLEQKYLYFKDLNDLLNNIDDIDHEFLYLLNVKLALTKSFKRDLEFINNFNNNVILGYNNIQIQKDTDEKIVNFTGTHDSNSVSIKSINFFKVKKNELKLKLEDKNIKNFRELSLSLRFNFISNQNYIERLEIINNIILDNNNLLLQNYRNLKNLKNIDNVILSYKKFVETGEKDTNINNVVLLYNELHEEKLSSFFIYDNHQQIIDFLKSSKFNINKNKIYIFNDTENEFDYTDINLNIEKLSKSKNCLFKAMLDVEYNYNCYFLNSTTDIKKILESGKTNIINGSEQFKILKMSSLFLKFFLIDANDFDEYMIKLGAHVLRYLRQDIFIVNENMNDYNFEDFKPNINSNLIDILYDKEMYDESSLLINFVIKFRLRWENNYIYKTFAVLDKINYYINPKDFKPLLDMLKFSSVDEFFSVCIILKYHHLEDMAINLVFDFVTKLEQFDKPDILKILFILYHFDILKGEIDLTKDKVYISFLLNNLDYINKNYQKINEFDTEAKVEQIYTNVLFFLSSRLDLIDNEKIKESINYKINSFLQLNLHDLEKEKEENIVSNILKYPVLMKSGIISLSDFMISTEDILNKRKNVEIFTDIIIKNWDKFEETFLNLVKKGNKLDFTKNFKYSYHGLPNRELFIKCIDISNRFLRLQGVVDNLDLNLQNENENLFYYEPKKTNKKKIGFFSNFLTRPHSVFKDRHQVIKYLSEKEDFEVFIFTFEPLKYKQSKTFQNVTEHIILGNMSINNIVKKIRSYNLDKLVFCEIGMDYRVINLAYFRMANKQYNTWGHSDTSGYKEIDYFVSSELYELPYEESQKHYSEKLILQKGLCTCYINPTSSYNLSNDRSYFGLSEHEKIILCPQSLFKIHPDFDLYLFEILLNNKNSSIVLLDNNRKSKMYERWDKVIQKNMKYYGVLSRVKFIPGQDHQKFCNLMKCADVLIDPYPFGGCNSSLESFSLFKPLVTQPSIRINGRFTYGFYKKMDMFEMIANNMEEYVNIITRLLNDKEFYDKQVNLLKERSDVLFEDQETLQEWEELMST